MTNLTEQWIKGELPEGWYWVEGSRAEGVYAYTSEYLNTLYRPRNSERIIEKVPSYDEWQAVHEQWKVLLDENAQLKELLKGAREVLKMVDTYSGDYDSINGFLIVEKINQVLGEE